MDTIFSFIFCMLLGYAISIQYYSPESFVEEFTFGSIFAGILFIVMAFLYLLWRYKKEIFLTVLKTLLFLVFGIIFYLFSIHTLADRLSFMQREMKLAIIVSATFSYTVLTYYAGSFLGSLLNVIVGKENKQNMYAYSFSLFILITFLLSAYLIGLYSYTFTTKEAEPIIFFHIFLYGVETMVNRLFFNWIIKLVCAISLTGFIIYFTRRLFGFALKS